MLHINNYVPVGNFAPEVEFDEGGGVRDKLLFRQHFQ